MPEQENKSQVTKTGVGAKQTIKQQTVTAKQTAQTQPSNATGATKPTPPQPSSPVKIQPSGANAVKTSQPQQGATLAKPAQPQGAGATKTAIKPQGVNSARATQTSQASNTMGVQTQSQDAVIIDVNEDEAPLHELTYRQTDVINHYINVMGFELNEMQFIRTEQFATDLFPIDIAIFAPTKEFNYYTITTVGLSQYKFPKGFSSRCELCMVLPSTWKPIFGMKEYYWAVQILQDIAYNIAEENYGISIGQMHLFSGVDDNKPYYECTDAIGGIICFPEMFPLRFFEEEIEYTFTRFLQVVTVNKEDVKKIDDVGVQDFITYELHDASGPQMVIKLQEPKGINKIITKNESSLKGN